MVEHVCGRCKAFMRRTTERVLVKKYKTIETKEANGGTSYRQEEDGTRKASVVVYACSNDNTKVYYTNLILV